MPKPDRPSSAPHGPIGAGKSTVAGLTAARLNAVGITSASVDLDDIVFVQKGRLSGPGVGAGQDCARRIGCCLVARRHPTAATSPQEIAASLSKAAGGRVAAAGVRRHR